MPEKKYTYKRRETKGIELNKKMKKKEKLKKSKTMN